MDSIYKYRLAVADRQTLMLPVGARILTVQTQDGEPHVWVMGAGGSVVNGLPRTIAIYGTGNPIPPGERDYIGTFQSPPFVWHVFEELP